MDWSYKELLVQRIISGTIRWRRGGKTIVFKIPSREHRYVAAELYHEVYADAIAAGNYDDSSLYNFLIKKQLWTEQEEKCLKKIPHDIDELKLDLFENTYRSNARDRARNALAKAKQQYGDLLLRRHHYDALSCAGVATIAKTKYLIGVSLFWAGGSLVFTADDFWNGDDPLLDESISYYNHNKITESEFRELARTDPWHSYFASAKTEGSLFGCAAVDLTEEQKTLVAWSSLYDNVRQHPKCPEDDVIEDDDMLDGWLIKQNRERGIKDDDDFTQNEKIRNSDEIYIVAETQKDAAKVYELNDSFGRALIKQQQDLIIKKGQLDLMEDPNTRLRFYEERSRG